MLARTSLRLTRDPNWRGAICNCPATGARTVTTGALTTASALAPDICSPRMIQRAVMTATMPMISLPYFMSAQPWFVQVV